MTITLVERLVACLMMQVVPRIGHMRCTGWPMSWGLIVPPGLEPDGWCMPVCVVHAPLYVYHLYFSQNSEKLKETGECMVAPFCDFKL